MRELLSGSHVSCNSRSRRKALYMPATACGSKSPGSHFFKSRSAPAGQRRLYEGGIDLPASNSALSLEI